jgi:nicotinamide-nucleotide amidase
MNAAGTPTIRRRATAASSEPFKLDLRKLTEMTPSDIAIRFAFGFAVSVVAGIIVNLVGPGFGGMFLAFPAILPATTTLLQRKNGLAQATADVRGATVGAVGMLSFALIAWRLLPETTPAIALLAALVAWLATCVVVFGVMRLTVRVLGENHYLPEIPTREAAAVLDALEARELTVSCAESCTGGLIASFFSSVPDASRVFKGGVVAYDEDVKTGALQVPTGVLDRCGAVSAAVAATMSRSVRLMMGTDVGLGVTGLTGSAADGKPAGLTFIAVTLPDGRTLVRRYADDFGPGRNDERAIRMSFQLLRDALNGNDVDKHNVDETVTA